MELEEAVRIVRDFSLWRRGNDDVKVHSPKHIGIALDVVLENAVDTIELKKVSIELFNKSTAQNYSLEPRAKLN